MVSTVFKPMRRLAAGSIRSSFIALFLMTFSLSSLAAFNFGADAEQDSEFLKVDQAFRFSSETIPQGLRIHWDIEPGYYLYQSKVSFKSLDGKASFGEAKFSQLGEEKEDPYFGIMRVIHNALIVELPIDLVDGATESEIQVSYQGCAEAGLCYPPRKQKILYLPVASDNQTVSTSAATSSKQPLPEPKNTAAPATNTNFDKEDASAIFGFMSEASLLSVVGIFFLLGIGLTFTPCVLPMIPIITTIVAGPHAREAGTARNLALALSYVLGMALTYALLGSAMGLLGASANLQAAMQHPAVLSIFAAVFVLLALAMFGVYDLQLPAFIRDRLNNESQKLGGGKIPSVFGIGALSAILVSPCVSAPLAGALLYISASGDAVLGFSSLLALGLGMGVPLIIVAVGGAKLVPSAGPWMNASKFIFGMLLLAVAIWLVGRMIPGNVSLGLWALLALACSVYSGAFEAAQSGSEKLKKTIGLALFLLAAVWFVGAFSGAEDPLRPLHKLVNGNSPSSTSYSEKLNFDTITSLQELRQAQQRANEQNKIALVDVYADWCISCIVMEREVFTQTDVSSLMKEFYLIKADVTDNSDANVALLEEFELFGPPSYLFFGQDGQELREIRVTGETSKEAFVSRLEQALNTTR